MHPVAGFRTMITPQPLEVAPEFERELIDETGLDPLSHRGNALCGAVFSADSMFRYALFRYIGRGCGDFVVIGLNPSTADEWQDDPTIRRCKSFARREGCTRLVMLNLFAFRATKPAVMKAAPDPIGPANDRVIKHFASRPGAIMVAAWGVYGAHDGRAGDVWLAITQNANAELKCLGLTKEGHPKHPLYLPSDAPLRKFP